MIDIAIILIKLFDNIRKNVFLEALWVKLRFEKWIIEIKVCFMGMQYDFKGGWIS
jgi:hypothetical protein